MRSGTRCIASSGSRREGPGTASGVIFASIEDETGVSNIVVWPKVFEKFRPIMLQARLTRLIGIWGEVQKEGLVVHVIARQVYDLTAELAALSDGGEPAAPVARPDELKRGSRGHDRVVEDAVKALPSGRNFH